MKIVWEYIRKFLTIRDRPSQLERAVLAIICIAGVGIVWFVLTAGKVEERIIDPITLPGIIDTLKSFPRLWFERALARSAAWSLARVLGGFLLATAIGVPLGVCAGSFLRLNALLKPLSIFGRNIPIAALIPLTLMWFGLGELQKVMFIFLASGAFIFFDSVGAVENVPDSYLDAAYTLGARFKLRHGLLWGLAVGAIYGIVFAAA